MDESIGIKLIVGLGNPGVEYDGTRHNVGFMVIDRVLDKLKGEVKTESICRSLVYEGRCRGRGILLQKPQTFMNLSGEAVKGLAVRSRCEAREVLVVHDDMDLPLGRMRIRRGGSAGGHHGIESVIGSLGSEDFIRLRIGIGHGGVGREHVLGAFAPEELGTAELVVDKAAEAVFDLLKGSLSRAMNRYNAMDLTDGAPARSMEEKK